MSGDQPEAPALRAGARVALVVNPAARQGHDRAAIDGAARQLDRVNIDRVQIPACPERFQHFRRMSAVAERRIQSSLSRLDLQDVQYFAYADGSVHPCGRVALLDYLFHRIRILFGLQFFVFFLIGFGMRAGIPDTSLVFLLLIIHVLQRKNVISFYRLFCHIRILMIPNPAHERKCAKAKNRLLFYIPFQHKVCYTGQRFDSS